MLNLYKTKGEIFTTAAFITFLFAALPPLIAFTLKTVRQHQKVKTQEKELYNKHRKVIIENSLSVKDQLNNANSDNTVMVKIQDKTYKLDMGESIALPQDIVRDKIKYGGKIDVEVTRTNKVDSIASAETYKCYGTLIDDTLIAIDSGASGELTCNLQGLPSYQGFAAAAA